MITVPDITQAYTADFYLKILDKEDTPSFFEALETNRSMLQRGFEYINQLHDVLDAESYIAQAQYDFKNNQSLLMGIWVKDFFAGCIGLVAVDNENRCCRLEYWLGEIFQGKGIITRAGRLLINYAFEEWRMNRIEIHTLAKNYKSRGVPQRLNFIQEGILRKHTFVRNEWNDVVVYGLLRPDWK